MRPNLAVNRTPAGDAGLGERLVGAGYLVRWAARTSTAFDPSVRPASPKLSVHDANLLMRNNGPFK
jgi:hypothetical protein